jgi:hypothetical protein
MLSGPLGAWAGDSLGGDGPPRADCGGDVGVAGSGEGCSGSSSASAGTPAWFNHSSGTAGGRGQGSSHNQSAATIG